MPKNTIKTSLPVVWRIHKRYKHLHVLRLDSEDRYKRCGWTCRPSGVRYRIIAGVKSDAGFRRTNESTAPIRSGNPTAHANYHLTSMGYRLKWPTKSDRSELALSRVVNKHICWFKKISINISKMKKCWRGQHTEMQIRMKISLFDKTPSSILPARHNKGRAAYARFET